MWPPYLGAKSIYKTRNQQEAGSLFALFANPEDGRNVFSESSVDFYRNTRRYIPEQSSLL
jgi:hypothetical protein